MYPADDMLEITKENNGMDAGKRKYL